MTRHAIYVTRSHTRDGERITSRFDLTHYARVLEARAVNGLVLGGAAWQERGDASEAQ